MFYESFENVAPDSQTLSSDLCDDMS